MTVESNPTRGTTVTVSLPLDSKTDGPPTG
jgi:hypothetical protein